MWAHLLWGVIGHELCQNGQRLPARPIDDHDVLRLRPLRFDCYGEWGARGRRRWPVNYPATCRAHRLGLMPGCGDPERPPELRGEGGERETREGAPRDAWMGIQMDSSKKTGSKKTGSWQVPEQVRSAKWPQKAACLRSSLPVIQAPGGPVLSLMLLF